MNEPHTPPLSRIIPNTTQIPHIIIREWMPRLTDVELRVLLVIVDQTLGWIADTETGRRKDRDWISMSQLILKTGKGRTKISAGIKSLIEIHGLIEATNPKGKLLDTAEKRKQNRAQIFYRLTLKEPTLTLFDAPRVRKVNTGQVSVRKVNTEIPNTTKETLITKENTMRPEEPAAREKTANTPSKPPSEHSQFVRFFYEATKATRGVKPIITGADAKALKRILDSGVPRETLEQAAIFFLSDYSFKKFSPTIRTLLSAGIITGLLNRMRNGETFWKDLDRYAQARGIQQALAGDPKKIAEATTNLAALKAKLAGSMAAPRVETHDLAHH